MKILIVKTSAIGDVIQTFPVLAYIKEKIPQCTLDWVVEKGMVELVASHPYVNKVISIDTKKWRKTLFHRETWQEIKELRHQLQEVEYDLLFDLQGNSKSALFTCMAKSKKKIGFGFKTLPEKLNGLTTSIRFDVPLHLSIQEQYLYLVQSYFQDFIPFIPQSVRLRSEMPSVTLQQPVLMVCFGSRWTNKQLPKETLLELLKMTRDQFPFSFLFVFGSEEEKKWAEDFNTSFPTSQMIGGLTLPQLQNLMHEVDAVLSMDSATLHLCGTTPTPSFSLFGPSSASVYKPLGEQHVAFQGNCPYGKIFVKRCPILRTCKTGACMKDLSAKRIFQELENFLKNLDKVELFRN